MILKFEIARSPKTKVLLASLQKVMNSQTDLNRLLLRPPDNALYTETGPNHFAPRSIPVLTAEEMAKKHRRRKAARKAAATRKANAKKAEIEQTKLV